MATIRPDGRNPDDLRALCISYDGLSRADGSARFAFGATSALASVSGPAEPRLAVEQASRAAFEVVVRPLAGVPGTESKHLAATLRALLAPSLLLAQHPRTLIQLVVQSLSPTPAPPFHPSLVAALINAATLALLNTGAVPMRGVTCAVAIGRVRPPTAPPGPALLVVDPAESELASLEGGGCFAFMFAAGDPGPPARSPETVWSSWQPTTPFDEHEFVRARDLARAASERVWAATKESVGRMGAPFGANDFAITGQEAFATDTDDDDKMEI